MRQPDQGNRVPSQEAPLPTGGTRPAPMRTVGSLFLPWLQDIVRDEKVAVIFLREFWPRIVGARLAAATDPLRLRGRVLEVGVPGSEWEGVLRGMTPALISKVNGFWNRSLVRSLEFRVLHPRPGDRST
jgi:hypothetical protein